MGTQDIPGTENAPPEMEFSTQGIRSTWHRKRLRSISVTALGTKRCIGEILRHPLLLNSPIYPRNIGLEQLPPTMQLCSNEAMLMLQQISVQLACNCHHVMIQSSKCPHAETFIYHYGYINSMHGKKIETGQGSYRWNLSISLDVSTQTRIIISSEELQNWHI